MRRADTADGGTNATNRKSSNASARPKTPSKRKKSGKKKGRPREARSTGRYPFKAAVNEYLELMAHGAIAKSTYQDWVRKYRLISEDIQYLHERNRLSTTNPKKMTAEDILQIIGCWRDGETREDTELSETYIRRLLEKVDKILLYCDNPAVQKFKIKYPSLMPSQTYHMLPSLSSYEFKAIIESAERVSDEDWPRMLGYGMVLMSMCASCRPLEVRNLRASDVHLDRELIHIETVKGKGDYGMPRDTPILPEALPFLHRYKKAREKYVKECGIKTDVFFPVKNYEENTTNVMCENTMIRYKNLVADDVGFDFSIQKCRRTYAQNLLDDRVPDSIVATCMGNTPGTLHKHYARHSREQAINITQSAITQRRPQLTPVSEVSPLIEKSKWDPGYA